jgi:glycine/D-amino acid oxidase-like deaminating enzyme
MWFRRPSEQSSHGLSAALQAVPWWWDEAGADEPAPALEGDVAADVCVIGGGYTGLWTALALKEREPSVHVVLLEAATCGSGPSGRNGGFVHGYWASLAELGSLVGREPALRLARAGERIVPAVRALDDDVWLREGGMLMVSASPAQDGAVEQAVAAAADAGAPEQAVPLDADAVAQRVRSPVFRRGVFFPDGATVQPARLVRALRRRVLAAGVELYEHSPATFREGEVTTAQGHVRATEVVVAINAAATGWRPAARHVTNFGSYVVLTEPVPELLEEIGWTGGEAIVDGRMFLHYFRTTNDGRVLMGSGSGPIGFRGKLDERFTSDGPTAARAEHGLRRLLPDLADARIERAWGGPIDVSADHLPFFKTVPGKRRVHYGLGYSGHGVGPSCLGGQILASLALGLDDEWTALPLATRHVPSLPPEPLKRLGGGLVRSAIMAVERADEEGRRAPLPARLGAALPRLFRMEIGTR